MLKLLLFGYYGEGNLGDELLLRSLISVFGKNHKVGILTNKVNKGQKDDIVEFNKFSIEILKGIRWTDVVIGGGGGIFQDKTSSKSFYYYLFIIFLSLLFKKKVYLIGQSFSPLKKRINGFLLRFFLNNVEKIYVRDSFSKNYLEKLGVRSDKIILSTDLAFLLDIPFPSREEDKKILGINLRKWGNLNLENLNSTLETLISKYDSFYFFSFQQEDSQFYEILKDKFKKIDLIEPQDPNFYDYYSSCRLFIGMRLHSCILSVLLGIPFIAISYDEKVEAFCHDIGWKFIIKDFSWDKILCYVNEIEENYKDYKDYLLSKGKILKEKAKEDIANFEEVLCRL